MNILFPIHTEDLLDTYGNIRRLLSGYDMLIFDAAVATIGGRRRSFSAPSNSSEFEQKHTEIQQMLRFSGPRNLPNTMRFMEEIWNQSISAGGVPGVSQTNLLSAISFQTKQNVLIKLNEDLCWSAQWTLPLHFGGSTDQKKVPVEIYNASWGEIVPSYVLQYIDSAINSYLRGMNAAAVALLAITVEATLRDVLETKGYSFNPAASSVDVYKYTKADVSVDGNSYILTFRETLPKSTSDFPASTQGASAVEVEIKRTINKRKNRTDLSVKLPDHLLDHLSVDTIEIAQQKRVNGLGEALEIARVREGFLTPAILTEDFDDVIQVVRNNLIHLSGEALSKPLYTFDPSGNYTLKDFISEQNAIYDFISVVCRFVSEQYIELRRAGHLVV